MRLLAIVGALLAILSGAVVLEGGPDPVIYPRQRIPIYYTHAYHVKDEGLACDFCHEKIGDSSSSADRDVPGHGSCDDCHSDWIGDKAHPAPREGCAHCHKDPAAGSMPAAAKLDIPPPNIKFPHKDHVKAGIECTDCHTQVPFKTVATRDDWPTMDRCVGCHQDRGVSTACKTCHFTGVAGRVVTRYPEGVLEPRRFHVFALHTGDFLRSHGAAVQRDRPFCNNCHTEADCLACHNGVGRDVRYHPGDWISMHSLRAIKDDYRCQACHRLQSFCLDCHIRSGVASVTGFDTRPIGRQTIRRDPTTGLANGPHPMAADGWIDPRSKNFHGFFAQRNIRACASCHQEEYCLQCHASAFPGTLGSGIGGNPHGPHPERLRGSNLAKHNARVCLKCHNPMDRSWR